MNTPDLRSANPTISPAPFPDLHPARRLIVLIPADIDCTAAPRKIQQLAHARQSRVLLLGRCRDAAQESSLRRQLVTMSALVQDGAIRTEIRVEIGMNWVDAIKPDLQDGDVIVCFAGHRDGLLQRPLSRILESNLRTPVHVLSGVNVQNHRRSDWLSQVGAWSGSLGIIAGSAWLQFRVVSFLPRDWAQTTLLIILIVIEAWLIWVWNGLFG
jgi:hypothetical protein